MPSSRSSWGTLWCLLLACGTSVVVLEAAGLSTRYDAELTRLRSEWSAAARAEGLDPRTRREALYKAHPTPEITLARPVVIAPGGSAPVSLTGKFRPNTVFLIEHDAVTLSGAATSGGAFKATATVAADALPGFVRVFAYAPLSGAHDQAGLVVIGSAPRFALTASNGWSIRLAPEGKGWTVNDGTAAHGYRAEYFTAGSATPFETTTGTLTVAADARPVSSYTFSLQPGQAGNAMAEYQALMAKMSNPGAFAKMSARERAAFDKQMETVGDRMTKELEAMSANPAAVMEKQARFGCGSISLDAGQAEVTGAVSCGQEVGYLRLIGKHSSS